MKITTERLFIRALCEDDWQAMKNIAADFARSEYVVYDMPLPLEDGEIQTLTKQFASSGLFFAVFLRDSKEMIGYVCFHNDSGVYDLGYCFHSAYHGKGYAFESCLAMMDHMTQTCDVKAFTAGTALENTPSCRLLEKLGFVCTGTEKQSFHKDENGMDIVFVGGLFSRNGKGAVI